MHPPISYNLPRSAWILRTFSFLYRTKVAPLAGGGTRTCVDPRSVRKLRPQLMFPSPEKIRGSSAISVFMALPTRLRELVEKFDP